MLSTIRQYIIYYSSMDKTEFIKYLSKKNRRSRSLYTDILNEIINGIMDQVARGKSVQLTGFGKFHMTKKKQVTQKKYTDWSTDYYPIPCTSS
ncbi:MAG: HU family DNA-binding protein, partial [Ktedonobacterales bacterium]